jgi:hypothetical protein
MKMNSLNSSPSSSTTFSNENYAPTKQTHVSHFVYNNLLIIKTPNTHWNWGTIDCKVEDDDEEPI